MRMYVHFGLTNPPLILSRHLCTLHIYHAVAIILLSVQDSLGTPEHRQAILISGGPAHVSGKLLAVPTIPDGTGLSQARATMTALQEWGADECVVGLCYDTTASNTGRMRGAVTRLEEMLGRKLMRLECRHHVLELVIGAVSSVLFGPTSGPNDRKFEEVKRK